MHQQFWELRINYEHEFPKICPYAFAYVFWRQSLLLSAHFYQRNTRGDDVEEPRRIGIIFQVATKLIDEELLYFYREFQRLQPTINTQWAMQEMTPSWNLIQKIKHSSFHNFSFKVNLTERDKGSIEYYQLRDEPQNKISEYDCPNCTISSRRNINRMKSFTPMTMAMRVFDNPCDEDICTKYGFCE
ncbi:hypothetical protein [Paenibacillus guangzhouensis]|uniref:hypothetical protein n=1 Tax=Paenibacillus guangzhouensis TaxID=1473112 RepID=UPI0012668F73|nr:hypothetical protein [Paenibacillus guangzhouensis]